MGDDRQIKILHADLTEDLVSGFEADESIDFFSKSPETCRGAMNTSPDGLVFYEFS